MQAILTGGTPAPDFSAKREDGQPIRLSNLRGKKVVLTFWSSWNRDRAAMARIQDVVDRLQKEGHPVTALAVDDSEKASDFRKLVKKEGAIYPVFTFAHATPLIAVSNGLYRASDWPVWYVIDSLGTIQASSRGDVGPTDDLEEAIRAAK